MYCICFKAICQKALRIFITFNLIAITWIFFRSATFEQAFGILKNITIAGNFWNLRIQDSGVFASMLLGLALLLIIEVLMSRSRTPEKIYDTRSLPNATAWIVVFTLLLVLLGVSDGDQFIYFQF